MKHRRLIIAGAFAAVGGLLWTLVLTGEPDEWVLPPNRPRVEGVSADRPADTVENRVVLSGNVNEGIDSEIQERRCLEIILEGGPVGPMPVSVVFVNETLKVISKKRLQVAGKARVVVPDRAKRAMITSLAETRASVVLEGLGDSVCVLRFKDLIWCQGRVVRASDGAPLGGAFLMAPANRGSEEQEVAKADDGGNFAVWLPAQSMIAAKADGFCASRGLVITQRHHGETLVMKCAPEMQQINVHVRNDRGENVSGAHIVVGDRWSNVEYDPAAVEETWVVTAVHGTTDSDGKCYLRGSWEGQGSIWLCCDCDGYATVRRAVALMENKKGHLAATRDVEIAMTQGVGLTGRVVDTRGGPIANVRVWLDYGTWAEDFVWTDSDGRFHFEKCDMQGDRVLEVNSRGWIRTEVQVRARIEKGVVVGVDPVMMTVRTKT